MFQHRIAFPAGWLLLLALIGSTAGWAATIDPLDPASFDVVSKGKYTTRLKGSGFTPNSEVTLFVTDPTTGEDVDLGFVNTDKSGNFDEHWLNLSSTAAAIQPGLVIKAVQGTTTVQVTAKKDWSIGLWTFASLGTNVGPLTNQIVGTELADAGFSGTIDLTALSSNATLVSEATTFDGATDTISTTGKYNLLAFGTVSGTYSLTGTFSNVFDPTTGQPITSPQSLTTTEDIGLVVPEPSGLAAVGLFALALIAKRTARRRR